MGSVQDMLPLYRDPLFHFRFAEPRIIPRFHLEGVAAGRVVHIHRLHNNQPGEFLQPASVGLDGWVDLVEPLIVDAELGFCVRVIE